MVAAWLLETFNNSLFGTNIFEGSDREVGNRFVPQVDCKAVGIRWHRSNDTPSQKPTTLRIWDTTTGTVTWSTTSIPDATALGWKAAAIPEVPTLLGGRPYIVSMLWQTNRWHTLYGLGGVPPAPFPGAWGRPMGKISPNTGVGYPSQDNDGYIYGVDVQLRAQSRPVTWTSVDSVAFDTEIVWNTPANRYVLTITSAPQWQSAVMVGAFDVKRVPGFWQPIINGSLGQQGRIESLVDAFALPGWQLMDGILIKAYPGTLGTLQGFTLDA